MARHRRDRVSVVADELGRLRVDPAFRLGDVAQRVSAEDHTKIGGMARGRPLLVLIGGPTADMSAIEQTIDEVMAAQRDLVEPLARFEPRLVKMAPSGEPPED